MDAALIFDIDSSRARTAATDLAKVNAAASKLAGTWSKSENAIRRANGQFASTAEVVNRYGREVQELAAKYNPALNAVYKFQQAEAELNRAIALGVLTKEQAAMQLERLSQQYQETANRSARAVTGVKGFADGSRAVGKAAEVSTHHVTNLSYQLNDIGMMMASGQSPFMLMIQQGPQVSQVFSQMATQGQRLGPTLAAAFRMVINPTTLLTLALIGGSAALVQWGRSALGAGEEAKTTADRLSELQSAYSNLDTAAKASALSLDERIAKYGQYWMSIKNVTDQLHELSTIEAQRASEGAVSALGIDPRAIEGMENQIRSFMQQREDMSEQSRRIAIEALGANQEALDSYGLQHDQLVRLNEIQKELGRNDLGLNERNRLTDEFVALLRQGADNGASLKKEMEDAAKYAAELAETMSQAHASTERADRAMKAFSASASSASLNHLVTQAAQLASHLWDASGAAQSIGGRIASSAWGGAVEAAANAWEQAVDRVQQVERNNLGARPRARPFSVSETAIYGPESSGGGGGGSSGGGGGKSPADQLAEEMKRRWEVLNQAFSSEYALAMQSYTKDQETLKWALDTKLITQQEYVSNLDMLYTNAWGAQWEKDQLQYSMDQQALQTALDNKLIAEEDYLRKRSELNWGVVSRLGEDMSNAWAFELGNFSKHLGEMNQIAGGYDGILRAQKVFGAASALISTYTGAAEALKLPFPQNIAAAAKVLATGMGFVNAIKGSGGSGGGGGSASASANPAVNTQPALQDRFVTVNFDGPQWMRDGINGLLEEIYQQSKDGRRIIVQEAR